MTKDDYYWAVHEVGPYWVTVSADYEDHFTIRILQGEWEACQALAVPIEQGHVMAWATAKAKCVKLLLADLNYLQSFNPKKMT